MYIYNVHTDISEAIPNLGRNGGAKVVIVG